MARGACLAGAVTRVDRVAKLETYKKTMEFDCIISGRSISVDLFN